MGAGMCSYAMRSISSGYSSWLNHDEHGVHLSKSGDQDIDPSRRENHRTKNGEAESDDYKTRERPKRYAAVEVNVLSIGALQAWIHRAICAALEQKVG